MKLKIGDEVLVTAGKEKGKRGKLERLFPGDDKALVGGLNMFKKHVRNQSTNDRTQTGGVIDIAKPLPVGSLVLVCKKCTKPTRVGYRLVGDKKVRICRKCGEEI